MFLEEESSLFELGVSPPCWGWEFLLLLVLLVAGASGRGGFSDGGLSSGGGTLSSWELSVEVAFPMEDFPVGEVLFPVGGFQQVRREGKAHRQVLLAGRWIFNGSTSRQGASNWHVWVGGPPVKRALAGSWPFQWGGTSRQGSFQQVRLEWKPVGGSFQWGLLKGKPHRQVLPVGLVLFFSKTARKTQKGGWNFWGIWVYYGMEVSFRFVRLLQARLP